MVRASLPAAPEAVVTLAVEAGRAILEVYKSDFAVDFKADRSPEECVQGIVLYLEQQGYIGAASGNGDRD